MPRAELVRAWVVSEGDRLPGGETVILVDREPVSGNVTIVCDDGERRHLHRDDRITVTCLGPRHCSMRVPRFIDVDVGVLRTGAYTKYLALLTPERLERASDDR
jgi:hypothetical protein